MIYSDELGYTTGVATAYTAITGSPYNPKLTGRLLQIRLSVAGGAATALMELVVIKLTNPEWGVPLIVTSCGGGLRTAPAIPIPVAILDCDLPVKIGSQITVEYKHISATTPVTPEIEVVAVFEG